MTSTRTSSVARGWGALALLIVGALAGWFLRRPGPADAAPAEAQPSAGTEALEHAREWTCSMHPQVRRSEPGRCPLCDMDLIPVALDTAGEGGARRLGMSPAARALASIRTRRVERRPVATEVQMVGRIEVDETRLSSVTTWVGGRIERLFVDSTGVAVNAGEHLVELYSPELYAAQEELLQARRVATELEAGAGASARLAAGTMGAARERLRQWGMTEEQLRELEERDTASDRVTIYAPQSGVVIHREAVLGMYVETGTHIYTLADLSRVWVLLEAYEADLAWLRYGQSVEFTASALPGASFEGTIAFIDPVLDPRTRTVRVRVHVDNEGRELKPQMFVSARVRAQFARDGELYDESLAGKWICPMHPEVVRDAQLGCDVCGMDLVTPESLGFATQAREDARDPLVVPASAVLRTGRRAIVYVELEGADEPTFEGREVVLGPRAGQHYVVRRGLSEGERVVVQGNFKIDSALQLLARPSMMLPDGGGSSSAPQRPGPAAAAALGRVEQHFEALGTSLERGDLQTLRQDFGRLEACLDSIDADDFTGEGSAVWRELAMVLGNDAAEGSGVRDLEQARQLQALAASRMQQLRAVFGKHAAPTTAIAASPGFRAWAHGLWSAYEDVRSALAADDPGATREAWSQLDRARAELSGETLSSSADALWKEESARLAALAPGAQDDLDALRVQFEELSASLTRLVEAFSIQPMDVLEMHCPMAFDGRGASWLQSSSELGNPYYGASMLRCGSHVRTLAGSGPEARGLGDEHGD